MNRSADTHDDSPGPGPVVGDQTVVDWIRARARSVTLDTSADLDDLEPLRDIVAEAPVVGLGDAVRAHQPLVLSLRVIRFLVERLGFRVLALEESALAATWLDRYVQEGRGDPATLLRDHAWEPWQTAEMGQALQWMRRFTLEHPEDPLRVVGVDIARYGELTHTPVIDHLAPLVPEVADELQSRYAALSSALERGGLDRAHEAAHGARELIAAQDPTDEQAVALQRASAIVGFFEFRLSGRLAVAEQHLATNTIWAHEHFDSRVIYRGGLAHVAASAHREVPGLPEIDRSAGSLLRERFADGYVPIGMTSDYGKAPYPLPPAPPSFADAHFAYAELESCLLDLGGPASETVSQWLGRPSRLRVLGPGYRAEDNEAHHMAGDSLADRLAAILYIREVTASHPLS